jgi:hypothetical protein
MVYNTAPARNQLFRCNRGPVPIDIHSPEQPRRAFQGHIHHRSDWAQMIWRNPLSRRHVNEHRTLPGIFSPHRAETQRRCLLFSSQPYPDIFFFIILLHLASFIFLTTY